LAKFLAVAGKMPVLISAEVINPAARPVVKPAEENSPAFGKYLVEASCIGCHGPELSGGPIEGGDPSWPPAANLRQSGLGDWKEDDFIKAMKTGQTPKGKTLRAPMLGMVEYGKQLNDTELKAMWGYISTLAN
jgi:mono/diheme cytochrome c family protein